MKKIKKNKVINTAIFLILFVFCNESFILAQIPTPTTSDLTQATAIFNEGISLYQQNTKESYQKASEKFKEAKMLYERLGDKQYEAYCLGWLGNTFLNLNEKQKALDYNNQALILYKQVSDKSGEAVTLSNIGGVYDALGEKQKALNYYIQSLNVYKESDDKNSEALILSIIATIHQNLKKYQIALDFFLQALSKYKIIKDKSKEAQMLYNIGSVYTYLSNDEKALEYYNQAASNWLLVNDSRNVAMANFSIGIIYSHIGEKAKALNYYEIAARTYKSIDDKMNEAVTLANIGIIYFDLGIKSKAIENYNQALSLYKIIDNKIGVATIYFNLGTVFWSVGENGKSLDYLNVALKINEEFDNKSGIAINLLSRGAVYLNLGEYDLALSDFTQSAEVYQSLGDKNGQASSFNAIGTIYTRRNNSQKALEYYDKALILYEAIGRKIGQATIYNNIGTVYVSLKDYKKALEYYERSLLARDEGDKGGKASSLFNIGTIYYFWGEYQKALDKFKLSLPFQRFVGDTELEANSFDYLARVYIKLKNPKLAVYYWKLCINTYQRLRTNITNLDRNFKQSFLKQKEVSYRSFVDFLIHNNRYIEAQQLLNSFKDQQVFDLNSIKKNSAIVLTQRETEFSDIFNQKLEHVSKEIQELETVKRDLFRLGGPIPNVNEQELKINKTTNEFLDFLEKVETEFAGKPDEKDKVGEVPDLAEMQKALADLNKQTGQKTAVIYQVVGEENFSALVITQNSIESVRVPFKGEELNEKALQLWGLLQSDQYDTTILSKEIYDVVFKPLEAKLPKDTTTIMWALDGNLRYLPMAALFDGKKFLAERYTHAVFTRADASRMLSNVSKQWTGTGFGSSNESTVTVLGSEISFDALPGVKTELSEIFKTGNKGILTGETFADKQFSKPNFINALKKQKPLVHIASHFSFRPGDEARSFLLMGDQTAFTLEEMKQQTDLFKGVELLTLSACNTAAQQPGANGREIDGFAELAQRLGAGAVMATLWQVSDASTPWLMRDFYSNRENEKGISKIQSLQKAQLGLLNGTAKLDTNPTVRKSKTADEIKIEIVPDGTKKTRTSTGRGVETFYVEESDAPKYQKDENKPYAHPYYWSPFVLYGNWK